ALGLDGEARTSSPGRRLERVTHRRAVVLVLCLVDVGFAEQAGERFRAEERSEVPLLVAEHRDIDADIAACFLDGTRSFQRVDAAERAIEPARMVLRLEVRARQCLGAARLALSQN